MRDPELWEQVKAKPFDDAFCAEVQALQNGDVSVLIEAFRRFLYLSSVAKTPVAVPTTLAPVLSAYRKCAGDDVELPATDKDASHGELLALYQLEFGEGPPADLWGEKVTLPKASGTPPVAWVIAGVLAVFGVILAILGQWWFFLPVLVALIVLAGWGKKPSYKRGFVYDWPSSGSTVA